MPLPTPHPLDNQFIQGYCPSVGAAPATVYIRIPMRCQIVQISSCLQGPITTANGSCAVALNGGASFATLTIPFTGSAAGQVNTVLPNSITGANEGDVISITPSGASGAAAAIFDISILQV
jgi:hypothetical protein